MPSFKNFPRSTTSQVQLFTLHEHPGIIWNSNVTRALLPMPQSFSSVGSLWKLLASPSPGDAPTSYKEPSGKSGLMPAVAPLPFISVGWPCVGLCEGVRTDKTLLQLLVLTAHAQPLTGCCRGLSFQSVHLVTKPDPSPTSSQIGKRSVSSQTKVSETSLPMGSHKCFPWPQLSDSWQDGECARPLMSETPRCWTFIKLTASICSPTSLNRKKSIHIFQAVLPLPSSEVLSRSIQVHSWVGPCSWCGRGVVYEVACKVRNPFTWWASLEREGIWPRLITVQCTNRKNE